MLTGDYPETSMAIARQIQLDNNGKLITGKEVMHLSPQQLKKEVKKTDVFARMFPKQS